MPIPHVQLEYWSRRRAVYRLYAIHFDLKQFEAELGAITHVIVIKADGSTERLPLR